MLFVISAMRIGGSEQQLVALAAALAPDTRVAVYSFIDGDMREPLEQSGVEVMIGADAIGVSGRVGAVGYLRAAFRLFRVMVARRPRIVHFFLPAADLVGAPLAVLARVPVRVMSRRSLNNYQRNGIVRAVERLWHRAMHAVLGNSRSVVEQLKAEGVRADRLGLVYNGVDDVRFRAAGRREAIRMRMNIAPASLVMTIVANLFSYKGHADLIDALAVAAPRLPAGWRLLVVGRDEGVGVALHEQSKRLGLQDHIVFLGARLEVADILCGSDLGILCSHEEGFSNAILEGMAAGLPMIVTNVGGNAEAVLNGETGLIVPARDSHSLAAAIVQLGNAPELRRQYGDAGRRRVAEKFGMTCFVHSHRDVYAALCAGRALGDVPSVAVR